MRWNYVYYDTGERKVAEFFKTDGKKIVPMFSVVGEDAVKANDAIEKDGKHVDEIVEDLLDELFPWRKYGMEVEE